MSEQSLESNTTLENNEIPSPDGPQPDRYGYITDEPKPVEDIPTPPASEEKPVEDNEDDETVETPSTGYKSPAELDEPKPDEPKPDDQDEPEPKEEEKTQEEYEKEISETLENLPEHVDKEKMSKFALDNKMSKEQVEAYIEFTKNEQAQLIEQNKAAVKKQREDWAKELQTDASFGGENGADFDRNVDRVEKVLEKYMPETKKVLTERGSMLPPYVMKDFLALYKVMNPSNEFVAGQSPQPEENKSTLDIMYS